MNKKNLMLIREFRVCTYFYEMLEIRHPRFVDSDDLWLGFSPPPLSFDSTSQIKIGFATRKSLPPKIMPKGIHFDFAQFKLILQQVLT